MKFYKATFLRRATLLCISACGPATAMTHAQTQPAAERVLSSSNSAGAAEPLQKVSNESHELHNLWLLSPRILSGSEPKSEKAFEELAQLGVKTIVSVDGLAPRLELAEKHGLRYIHIPFGYDGIPIESQLALVRVAREVPGKIYVHCHHGKHRGPAGAAILCRADDGRSAADAQAILQAAGTGREYAGLWRDVDAFKLPAPSTKLPELVPRVAAQSLAASMAELDRTFDRVKLFAASDWKTLAPDLAATDVTSVSETTAIYETTLLLEHFAEAARLASHDRNVAKVPELGSGLASELAVAAALAKEFATAMRAQPINETQANALFQRLQTSCTTCHAKHRN